MKEARLMKLFEKISTFDNWVSPKRLQQAMATYEQNTKTQEGQLQLLKDASAGNATAADYLFHRFKGIVGKAFWTYYLGPQKQYHQRRLQAGADDDFASAAYNMLLGGGEARTSPFKTFNPKKFTDKADLVKQFGYYYYRYLQNEAIKMIRAEKMGGIAGNIPAGTEVKTVGYDDHYENNPQASTGNFASEVDVRETLKAFLAKLKAENTKYYEVFKQKMQGDTFEDIATAMGISTQSVRNHMKAIHSMYKEFTGE